EPPHPAARERLGEELVAGGVHVVEHRASVGRDVGRELVAEPEGELYRRGPGRERELPDVRLPVAARGEDHRAAVGREGADVARAVAGQAPRAAAVELEHPEVEGAERAAARPLGERVERAAALAVAADVGRPLARGEGEEVALLAVGLAQREALAARAARAPAVEDEQAAGAVLGLGGRLRDEDGRATARGDAVDAQGEGILDEELAVAGP